MKHFLIPRRLKLIVPGCGILGLVLRQLLVATGTDDKGLFVTWHPAWIGLLLLSAAAAAVVGLGIRHVRGSGSYRVSFPYSNFTAAGYFLAAIGAVSCAIAYWQGGTAGFLNPNPAASITQLLGGAALTLAPVALVLVGLCRRASRKPFFLFHGLICVYFAIQALTLYRSWSFDPQLQDYCFQLFACIALTITAYQLAMFDIGKGSHRRLWLWGLAAVFLCCVSMGSGLFYITGAFWAFTSLSSLRRKRYLRQPEQRMPVTETSEG